MILCQGRAAASAAASAADAAATAAAAEEARAGGAARALAEQQLLLRAPVRARRARHPHGRLKGKASSGHVARCS